MSEVEIRHNVDRARYEAWIGDQLAGFADYHRQGSTVIFPHTVTEPEFGGRGVASALARASLDDVRAQGGLRVIPSCSFYAGWIERNPQYGDLVESR